MAQSFHVLMPTTDALDKSPFEAVIETLVWGFQQAGYEASFAFGRWRDGATPVVLCPHLLSDGDLARLPPSAILYNLDQISPSSPLPPASLWRLRHWRIWDYSPRNQAIWGSLGIESSSVPVGWCPQLERIPDGAAQDIDVLFYGALNHRREAVLNRLARLGLHLVVVNQAFGRELDALIGRAKLVLNLHYYPSQVLETVRISYLLANGRAVISERSPLTEVPQEYERALLWAPYEGLVEACLDLVGEAPRRSALGAAGRAAMRRLAIAPILRNALTCDAAWSRMAHAA